MSFLTVAHTPVTDWFTVKYSYPENFTGLREDYAPRAKVSEKYLVRSDKVGEHPRLGRVQFYHIDVPGAWLANAAWMFESDKAGEYQFLVGFRVRKTAGDGGERVYYGLGKPEDDGAVCHYDWFG